MSIHAFEEVGCCRCFRMQAIHKQLLAKADVSSLNDDAVQPIDDIKQRIQRVEDAIDVASECDKGMHGVNF